MSIRLKAATRLAASARLTARISIDSGPMVRSPVVAVFASGTKVEASSGAELYRRLAVEYTPAYTTGARIGRYLAYVYPNDSAAALVYPDQGLAEFEDQATDDPAIKRHLQDQLYHMQLVLRALKSTHHPFYQKVLTDYHKVESVYQSIIGA